MATRIPIHVSNHTAFVWDVDHAATLRSEHRICGVLTGTLPHLSQQNVFLGLPLVLMPEELVLLVEKQLAMIVHDPAAHHTPTPSQLETWDAERRQDVALQLVRLEQRKAEDRASAAASAAAAVTTATTATPVPQDATLAATIQQKRAEREARRRQLAAAAGTSDSATGPAASGASIPGSEERERDGATPASNTTTTTNTANNANAVYTVSVPTTSDAFAWYDYDHDNSDNREHDDPDPQQQQPRTAHTHTHTYETLDAARTARVWVYPSSAEERARCEVFRDLWEKGYFMGGGSKFGGDWLVYPGDPLRYHSHFVATVQHSPSAPLRPMEVVAHGRLGTATKKAHLLCGWDPVSREVTYISIEWAGFG